GSHGVSAAEPAPPRRQRSDPLPQIEHGAPRRHLSDPPGPARPLAALSRLVVRFPLSFRLRRSVRRRSAVWRCRAVPSGPELQETLDQRLMERPNPLHAPSPASAGYSPDYAGEEGLTALTEAAAGPVPGRGPEDQGQG